MLCFQITLIESRQPVVLNCFLSFLPFFENYWNSSFHFGAPNISSQYYRASKPWQRKGIVFKEDKNHGVVRLNNRWSYLHFWLERKEVPAHTLICVLGLYLVYLLPIQSSPIFPCRINQNIYFGIRNLSLWRKSSAQLNCYILSRYCTFITVSGAGPNHKLYIQIIYVSFTPCTEFPLKHAFPFVATVFSLHCVVL